MSAAAAREPARAWPVARHYLALLRRETAMSTLLLAALPTAWSLIGSRPLDGFWNALGVMFFFALFQWRGPGRLGALDAALPMGRGRHDLLRVACGAAWACAALAVGVGVATALTLRANGGTFGWYPAWYPAALFAMGLALYLLGAAVWLRAERPGRVLLLAFFVGNVALLIVEIEIHGVARNREELRDALVRGAASAPLWLAASLVAVGLAVTADQWMPALRRAAAPLLSRLPLRRRRVPGVGRPAPDPAAPRRTAPLAAVLRWEAAMLAPAAAWPLLVALVIAALAARVATWLPGGTKPAMLDLVLTPWLAFLFVVAFFWPLLVWVDGGGPDRGRAEPLPVSPVAHRLARVAAGGAWLTLAVAIVWAGIVAGAWRAGIYRSIAETPAWLWAGAPVIAVALYLTGSLPVLVSPRRPFLHTAAWYFVCVFLLFPPIRRAGMPAPGFSALFGDGDLVWRPELLLWLPALAAAAALAAAYGVHRERRGGRFPAPSSA